MATDRLTYCLQTGGLILPEEGTIACFGASADGLPPVAPDRLHVISTMRPVHDALQSRGIACSVSAQGPYAAVVVTVPRARALAHGMIAEAVRTCPDGLIVVDGAKTDGIDSLLKAVRQRTEISGQASKAHGKVFWFKAAAAFDDWAIQGTTPVDGGFVTAPGIFSADGIDPASSALVQALPAKLGGHVADLGGGWGYLSAQALTRPDIKTLDIVEVDASALDCARINVTDPRARFHWADATCWSPDEAVDTVIMNPPFHTGRAAEPALGQAFITNAARILKPRGSVWMVANRHLPYETTLAEHFQKVSEVGGGSKFKILHAEAPKRRR